MTSTVGLPDTRPVKIAPLTVPNHINEVRLEPVNVHTPSVKHEGDTGDTHQVVYRNQVNAQPRRAMANIGSLRQVFVPIAVAATLVYVYASATGQDIRSHVFPEGTDDQVKNEGRRVSIFAWVDIGIAAALCFFFMSRLRNVF